MINICKHLREGDQVNHFFLIKEVEKRQGSNGNYLDLALSDQTGQINAKLWSCSDQDAETYVVQRVVLVKGYVKLFKDKPQLTIQQMRLAGPEDGIQLSDLIRSAPMQSVDMYTKLMNYIDRMANPEIKVIVRAIVVEKEGKLFSYPAGQKIHHDFYGGLLYHITCMLDLAQFVADQYPLLDADLLYAGVILHDIMKTEEMDAEMGVVRDYTVPGQLLGHITMGIIAVENAARTLGIKSDVVMHLQHMIAAHHQKMEYGSPVEPKLPEAEALCYIDMLDSRMNAIQKALDESKEEDHFTQPIRALSNRRVYIRRKEAWTPHHIL